jgi:outer membrane protein
MRMRLSRAVVAVLLAGVLGASGAAARTLTLDQAVAIAKEQNPEIIIARKQLEAAHGGYIEARSGYLPSVVSSGLLRKRESQAQSRLRDEDYSASLRVVQNVYSGGANAARLRIARLNQEKRELELASVTNRVVMEVRIAYQELLLNRAKIGVREESLRVMQEELRAQQERFVAGTVGELNVRRADVALSREQPELIEAETRLQNSFLRVNELLGVQTSTRSRVRAFETAARLYYEPVRPDLMDSLAFASTHRPEIRMREIDVEIEEQQLIIDKAELRPRVEAFSGYEIYSERDPQVGQEFNHGYVVGLNASWHLFDGWATKGRVRATTARRDAAIQALEAARRQVEADVRSAFFDLQQADAILQSETRNVENAAESLELARGNLSAGLGTQLDVLQAANDVTRTRTTRLSAIYLHNAAKARLARATARDPEGLQFNPPGMAAEADVEKAKRHAQVFDIARPPAALSAP